MGRTVVRDGAEDLLAELGGEGKVLLHPRSIPTTRHELHHGTKHFERGPVQANDEDLPRRGVQLSISLTN